MSEQALIPIEVRTVEFYGDEIIGALVRVGDEPQVYVPIRPICDYLGLSWSGQRERIMRDEVLAEAVRSLRLTRTNSRAGDPHMLCLPLVLLPGWLFGISTGRVKPALQPALQRYRRECYQALAAAFPPDRILPTYTDSEAAPRGHPGFVYIVRNGLACKIGRSKNAVNRWRRMNTNSPTLMRIIHTIATDDMVRLERVLLNLYKAAGKHLQGEWFNLSDRDVTALCAIPSPLDTANLDRVLILLERAARA